MVKIFGWFEAMSMPSSAIAWIAIGLIWSFGAEPAERTWTRSPPRAFA